MQCSKCGNNPRLMPDGGGEMLVIIIMFLALMICVTLLSGCKQTEYIPVVEHSIDTMYISKVQRDSIYLHDSTYIKEKGDTIFFEKWHTKYIEKLTHDTTYVATHDTIPQPYEVEKIVKERYTPKFVQFLAWVGGIGLGALLIGLVFKIWKKLY